MTSDHSNSSPTPAEEISREQRLGIPEGYILHQPFQDFWPNVILGVACWMGSGPVVFACLMSAMKSRYLGLISSGEILSLLFSMVLAWLVISWVVFFVGAIISFLVQTLLNSLNLYGPHFESATVACLMGGVTGLLLTLVGGPWVESRNSRDCLLALGVATILGQIGAIRGARKCKRYKQLAYRKPPIDDKLSFQFSIRQVLIITAWIALLLTLTRLAGMHTPAWGVFLGIWLTLQLAAIGLLFVFEKRHPLIPTS